MRKWLCNTFGWHSWKPFDLFDDKDKTWFYIRWCKHCQRQEVESNLYYKPRWMEQSDERLWVNKWELESFRRAKIISVKQTS